MRVVVLGGTGFIGSHVVRALVEAGHDVTVFHRGVDEPDLPASLRHVHGTFDRLADHRDVFQRLKPQVVLDETVEEAERLRRTIEWELMTLHQVPDLRLDYAAEDEALRLAVG